MSPALRHASLDVPPLVSAPGCSNRACHRFRVVLENDDVGRQRHRRAEHDERALEQQRPTWEFRCHVMHSDRSSDTAQSRAHWPIAPRRRPAATASPRGGLAAQGPRSRRRLAWPPKFHARAATVRAPPAVSAATRRPFAGSSVTPSRTSCSISTHSWLMTSPPRSTVRNPLPGRSDPSWRIRAAPRA